MSAVPIVGAGIAGLVLGRCLKARGIPTRIFDRRTATHRHTYSITLFPWAYQPLLDVLGLDFAVFRDRVAVAPNDTRDPAPFRVQRGRLESLLAEGLDVTWSRGVLSAEKSLDGICLSLEDGERVTSKVVVGADGALSQLRQSLSPSSQPKVLPFVVFNGRRKLALDEFEPIAEHFKRADMVEARSRDALLRACVDYNADNEVGISYTYSRSPRGSSDPLHRPDRSTSKAKDIPKELFEEVAAMGELAEPFRTIFDSARMEKDRLLHWLMRSVSIPTDELQRLGESGIAVLGDAAHATPILGSEGANVAIKDAMDLAACIAAGSSLRGYFEHCSDGWHQAVEESENRLARLHGERSSL